MRQHGSVRGVPSNRYPYRDRRGKPRTRPRSRLRITAPVPDPTTAVTVPPANLAPEFLRPTHDHRHLSRDLLPIERANSLVILGYHSRQENSYINRLTRPTAEVNSTVRRWVHLQEGVKMHTRFRHLLVITVLV